MADLDLTIRDSAAATITRMQEQTSLVNATWGDKRPETVIEMSLSLGKALSGLMTGGWGPATIHWDSELSLVTSTSTGFTFGTIFHGAERPDVPLDTDVRVTGGARAPREGRYCMRDVEDEGGRYCGKPIVRTAATCEGHEPFIVAMPVPGTWSFHS